MVKFLEKGMGLPLVMEVRDDIDDTETYGSFDLIDSNGLNVGLIFAENEEEYRTPENLLDTRKDAVYILNAVNNFEDMVNLILNYQKLLNSNIDNLNHDDLIKINNLINSFKTIDYENGIPYSWGDDVN